MNGTVERCTANIKRFLAGEPIHDQVGDVQNYRAPL